jgi:hypothetical protein
MPNPAIFPDLSPAQRAVGLALFLLFMPPVLAAYVLGGLGEAIFNGLLESENDE